MSIKQIQQIAFYLESHPDLTDEQRDRFLSAYPQDVVKAWRTGEIPEMEGRVTDVQLDKEYKEMTEETKQFLKEQSEKMAKIMPFCPVCKKQLALTGVCPGCEKGKEGNKSKFVCAKEKNSGCGYEEYFKVDVREKIKELEASLSIIPASPSVIPAEAGIQRSRING